MRALVFTTLTAALLLLAGCSSATAADPSAPAPSSTLYTVRPGTTADRMVAETYCPMRAQLPPRSQFNVMDAESIVAWATEWTALNFTTGQTVADDYTAKSDAELAAAYSTLADEISEAGRAVTQFARTAEDADQDGHRTPKESGAILEEMDAMTAALEVLASRCEAS